MIELNYCYFTEDSTKQSLLVDLFFCNIICSDQSGLGDPNVSNLLIDGYKSVYQGLLQQNKSS